MNISKNTFNFLNAIKENNNREWFQENRHQYELALAEFTEFSHQILIGLSKIDRTISADYPVSKCVFRIYRDIRFSKNKTPYKTFFSAGFSSHGRSSKVPGYYIQLEPEKSFAVAGIWQPEKEKLAAIRQEIDYNGEKFRSIVTHPDFLTTVTLDQDDQLKKAPKGYDPDHPDIEFLKLKSFMAFRGLKDEEVLSGNATQTILQTYEISLDFQEFLYEAV